jgi:hypothetical protein
MRSNPFSLVLVNRLTPILGMENREGPLLILLYKGSDWQVEENFGIGIGGIRLLRLHWVGL